MTKQEAFRILGLDEGADKAQIRHAYSEQTKIYHVETHPEEFGRLHEAYKTALASLQPDSGARYNTSFVGQEIFRKSQTTQEQRFSQEQTTESDRSPEKTAEDIGRHTEETEGGKERDSLEDLLREALGETYSVKECRELTQLFYHKCRYEERKEKKHQAASFAAGNPLLQQDVWEGISARWESPPMDRNRFLGTMWKDWKSYGWLCLICHPDFLKEQYAPGFLKELQKFLREENLNGRDGISQSLFFALCMAYGFFYDDCPEPQPGLLSQERPEILQEIRKILSMHPKRKGYVQDLHNWADLMEGRSLALLAQEAFQYSLGEGEGEERRIFAESFLDRAEEMLMADPDSEKNFIAVNFLQLEAPLFSQNWARRMKDCEALQRLREEFFREFQKYHDYSKPENNVNKQEFTYRPRLDLLEELRDRYGIAGGNPPKEDGGSGEKSLKKIVCNPGFMRNFWQWFHPSGSEKVFDPRSLEYEFWREFRGLFDGDSLFEKNTLERLTTDAYFGEYEKRYQKELRWQAQKLEEDYFLYYFPLPPLNEGKLKLLRTVEQGTEVGLEEVSMLLDRISKFDEDAFRLLTKITNALVHFNCLLVWPKQEKNPVPGDAFCFLEDEVILFRKKENRKCHLSHAAFYDKLAHYFELAAKRIVWKKESCYSGDFLDTCCANMYLYRCYISRFRASS